MVGDGEQPGRQESEVGGRLGDYFQTLGELARTVTVTMAPGGSVSFDSGVEAVIKAAFQAHANGRKLLWIGNGGSAAIASHMAIDYWKNGGIRSTSFNDASLLTCLSNDLGYEFVFAKAIEMLAQPGDLLVAISSSGRSANILRAVDAARAAECGVVTLSGFDVDNPLRRLGDVNFYVPSGEYGFVEIMHLSICHAILDLSMGLRPPGHTGGRA